MLPYSYNESSNGTNSFICVYFVDLDISIPVDENLALMDLFHDNELMEDLSLTNIELLAYLKLPKYYNAALE